MDNIIRALRKQRGFSQRELAELCSVHQTAVSQWENGRTSPDVDGYRKLAKALGVSLDCLADGGNTTVPVLGYVRAGIPMEAIENVLGFEEIGADIASRGEYFGLKVSGDSMAPLFQPGDTVIVRRQPDVDSGEIAVVLVNGDDAVVKKVIKKDTSIVLVSENSAYEPIIFSSEEVASLPVVILGRVAELRRKL